MKVSQKKRYHPLPLLLKATASKLSADNYNPLLGPYPQSGPDLNPPQVKAASWAYNRALPKSKLKLGGHLLCVITQIYIHAFVTCVS